MKNKNYTSEVSNQHFYTQSALCGAVKLLKFET